MAQVRVGSTQVHAIEEEMLLKFTEDAWADYCYWQTQDKKTLKRINMLIKIFNAILFCRNGNQNRSSMTTKEPGHVVLMQKIAWFYMMDGDSIAFLSFKDHY